MIKQITALTVAGFMLVGVAAADHHMEGEGKDKGAKFAKMDTNADGFITKDEMLNAHKVRVDEHFAKMDADKDGKLSQDEMKAGKKDMRKNMKERMDKWKEKKASKEAAE